jgi:hypothetical protein
MLNIWAIHNYDTDAQAQHKQLATIRIKVPPHNWAIISKMFAVISRTPS